MVLAVSMLPGSRGPENIEGASHDLPMSCSNWLEHLDLGRPSKTQLEKAMQGHVLAQAQLIGTYEK
jgi:Spy/CpxP family protein refolding chaperone